MRLPLAAAPLCLLSCAEPERAQSALLVTFDTTRADVLGCYGADLGLTPNLDVLARDGVVFEAAHTVAPLTLPAHASMLTGLYPPRHGLRDNGVAALAPAAETLAERARAAGLQTAAFVSSVVLDAGFGLDQGFERYDAPSRPLLQTDADYAERGGHATVARALEWLEARDPARGFFLWVHLWDPHTPYRAAPAFLARARGNEYLAEIAAADDALGALLLGLERAKLLDETLVVAVADHGEAFLEHDELSHGTYVWQTTLHVPLIVRGPVPAGVSAGSRVTEPVSVVDVAPTIAAALGLPALSDADGRSLFGADAARAGLYFESCYGYLNYGWSPLFGWLDGETKLMHGPRPRLFDWRADPKEERDRFAAQPEAAARALAALARVAESEPLPRTGADRPSSALQAEIAKLGYGALSGAEPEVPAPHALGGMPDPLARTQEQFDVQQAMGQLAAGKFDEAHASFARLIAANPGNAYARERAAIALIRAGRRSEAIAPLRALLAERPERPDAWCQLGSCLLAEARHEEALAAFRAALALDSAHVQALAGAIHVLGVLGREGEAAPLRARLEELGAR